MTSGKSELMEPEFGYSYLMQLVLRHFGHPRSLLTFKLLTHTHVIDPNKKHASIILNMRLNDVWLQKYLNMSK